MGVSTSQLSKNLLAKLVKTAQTQISHNKRPYAVFDADETIWKNDIQESLLAYLEWQSIVKRENLSDCHWPIPLLAQESLISYGNRILEIDPPANYRWMVQMFSGLSIKEIKKQVDILFNLTEPIPVKKIENNLAIEYTIEKPFIYPLQKQLIQFLMSHNIDVYVITASLEELVRMIVCDPQYGLSLPPSHVIGLNTLILNQDNKPLMTPRDAIVKKLYGTKAFPLPSQNSFRLSKNLIGLTTWYEGKVCAINEWIDPIHKPLLVAGDSPSDFPMLSIADVANNGLRVFIKRNDLTWKKLSMFIKDHKGQEFFDQGWVLLDSTALEQVEFAS